jgi:hypothetical protein
MPRPTKILKGYQATTVEDLVAEIKQRQANITDDQIDMMFKVALPQLWEEWQVSKSGLAFAKGRVYFDNAVNVVNFCDELKLAVQKAMNNGGTHLFKFSDDGFLFGRSDKGFYLQCLYTPKEEGK